jgi:ribosome-associated translation inhibitor RaiA
METSPAVEARIREATDELAEFYPRIIGCRVVAEILHHHRETGQRFHIRVHLTVPGSEINVSNEPSLHPGMGDIDLEERTKQHEVSAPHKDIYVAIRDVFEAARRQLQDLARQQRGQVKHHEARR